jgi:hypothetical protein
MKKENVSANEQRILTDEASNARHAQSYGN